MKKLSMKKLSVKNYLYIYEESQLFIFLLCQTYCI